MSKSALLLLLSSPLLAAFPVESKASVPASPPTTISTWDDVPMGPPDAILGIAQAFRASKDPRKVNVCVGAYRDTAGAPWVLPSVRAAENIMLEKNENKEYLPIEGDSDFIGKALKFAYGADGPLDRLAGVQSLSGTGACRIGGHFLSQFYPGRKIYIPTPTWGNHWVSAPIFNFRLMPLQS